MPFVDSNGCRIYYRLEGLASKPLLVLVHSLGTDHGMWDLQMPAMLTRFQVLRLDLRGHGASDAPTGDYTIAELGADVLAAAKAAKRERFAYCGLSLGGMIGQWLGANAGNLLSGLVLANTSPKVDNPNLFETRRTSVLKQGMRAVHKTVMERFFCGRVLDSPNATVESIRTVLRQTNPVGYAGCCAAIRDMDHCTLLADIKVPTLVIAGLQDISTPYAGHGEVLFEGIVGAGVVMLDAAHLSNVERPSAFSAALFDFLLPAMADDVSDAGLSVRRAVLGNAHVDRSIAGTTDFTSDFQQMITRYAWGTVWTRPGLDLRVRRLLVLAMTASLGRWEEFRLHVRTGLASELELTDLKEVLLQVAIYAGVPAANTGFHTATDEERRLEEQRKT